VTGSGFAIRLERTGTTVRIVAAGELDLATASQLRDHVAGALAGSTEIVVLDLAEITFIDSSGLQTLIEAAGHEGNRLRIIPSPACVRLFDITGVRDRLPLLEGGSSS
jgi:anti-anti-sigma factor